jgi:hypothetical protein
MPMCVLKGENEINSRDRNECDCDIVWQIDNCELRIKRSMLESKIPFYAIGCYLLMLY